MSKVKSNLKQILDQRELSIRKVSKDIDYRFDSVRLMYNDENKTFSRDLLARLCDYLDISLAELIVLENGVDNDSN